MCEYYLLSTGAHEYCCSLIESGVCLNLNCNQVEANRVARHGSLQIEIQIETSNISFNLFQNILHVSSTCVLHSMDVI